MLIFKKIKDWKKYSYLSYLMAFLGCLVFVLQLYRFAHTQTSFVDEGMYTYLGYKFVTGGISYNELGLWNYYAPLSYFIPGVIQYWLGPGLRVARYFSILLGILTIIPLWLTVRRLRGNWWAALLVWVIALMPIQTRVLSVALSQSIVNCFLGWSLFFILGENRNIWQTISGAFLAGVIIMTRQNMLPLLPLLILYIFWQHGKRAGFFSLFASLVPIIVIQSIFWPNILRMWSFYWLPAQWFPFLSKYGTPANSYAIGGTVDITILSRIIAFFWGFRAYYIPLGGAVASFLLWPKKRNWESEKDFRMSVFLGILFLMLQVVHLWASVIGTSNCVFCYIPYNAFYSNIALLFIIVSYPSWVKKSSAFRTGIIVLSILIIAFGLGLATFEQFGDFLLNISIPRFIQFFKSGLLQNGYPLWDILENRFNLEYASARLILPPVVSLIFSVVLIILIYLAKKFLAKRKILFNYTLGPVLAIVFLLIGLGLSPLMGTAYRENGDCENNVLQNYENIGVLLNELIPGGSNIYWNVDSAVPLLYLNNISMHPSQTYGIYTFRSGGDSREVEESGYWNDLLASQWLEDADYLIIQENATLSPYISSEKDLDLQDYDLSILPAVNPCNFTSHLFVYKTKTVFP